MVSRLAPPSGRAKRRLAANTRDNNEYLSVKLDDLSFGEPVNAALVVIDGVHSLVWSRSTAKAD